MMSRLAPEHGVDCLYPHTNFPTWLGTAVYATPPGRLMVSWGLWKTWMGVGHSGSVSPGAAAQMMVRLRAWGTP